MSVEYAYDIPTLIENYRLQHRDEFARPDLLIDWLEIEGPLYDSWRPSSHTAILFKPTVRMSERRHAWEILVSLHA